MPATSASTVGSFHGFPDGGYEFFLELQVLQDRAWFKTNQARYERLWLNPFRALMEELKERLAATYPAVKDHAPHVFRIQRDVRFGADKSPYKTFIAASLALIEGEAEERWGVPGAYLSFGLDADYIGVGQWMMEREQLLAFRTAVADDVLGGRLQAIVDSLDEQGFNLSSHESLQRVPTGFPSDHPRADLLKRKGLAVGTQLPSPELIHSRDLLDWVVGSLNEAAPLVEWLRGVVRGR